MTNENTPTHMQRLTEVAAGSHELVAEKPTGNNTSEQEGLPDGVVSINEARSKREVDLTIAGTVLNPQQEQGNVFTEPDAAGEVYRPDLGSLVFSGNAVLRYARTGIDDSAREVRPGVRERSKETLHRIRDNGNRSTKTHGPKPERPLQRKNPKLKAMSGYIIDSQRDKGLKKIKPIKSHTEPQALRKF